MRRSPEESVRTHGIRSSGLSFGPATVPVAYLIGASTPSTLSSSHRSMNSPRTVARDSDAGRPTAVSYTHLTLPTKRIV